MNNNSIFFYNKMLQSRPKPKQNQIFQNTVYCPPKNPLPKKEETKEIYQEIKQEDTSTNRIVKPSTALIINEMKAEVMEKMVCKEEFRSLFEKINNLDQYYIY
ncbi:MAG: hypothetical protein WCH77_12305 [Planctomycetota bacterium]